MIDWSQVSLVDRDSQVQIIQKALNSPEARFILVNGPPGCGKTAVVDHVLQHFTHGKGKYSQAAQQLPYCALDKALQGFFQACGPETVKRVSCLFEPEDIGLLCSVFGFLTSILPMKKVTIGHSMTTVNTKAVMLRFQRLVRRLVGALGSSSQSCVLFLDDLHWADDGSRMLLDAILKDQSLKHFFLVATVSDEASTPFETPNDCIPITQVAVETLDSTGVEHVLTQVCSKSFDVSRFTDAVYAKTKGNPFFVKQYAELLWGKRSLRASDKSEVSNDQSSSSDASGRSNGVEDLLVQKIRSTEPVTQVILVICSALGYTVRKDVLAAMLDSSELVRGFPSTLKISSKFLAGVNRSSMEQGLADAESHGLISIVDESIFQFSSNQVQKAARSLVPVGRKGDHVLAVMGDIIFGMSNAKEGSDRWLLQTATRLLCNHGSALKISEIRIANTCLESSKSSASCLAFQDAAYSADAGIRVLQPNPWKQETYNWCIELHNQSAEAYRCFNPVETKKRVKAIQHHASAPQDKFRGYSVLIDLLLREKRFSEAFTEAQCGLRTLGIKFSHKLGVMKVRKFAAETQKLLKRRKADDLLSLPLMTDEKQAEAIRLCAVYVSASICLGQSMSAAIGSSTALKITLQNGIGSFAAVSFVLYGVELANEGNIQDAYRFCRTAVTADFPVQQERQSFVIGRYCAFVAHVVHPLYETLEWTDKAYQCGLSKGEMTDACEALCLKSQLGNFLCLSFRQLSWSMEKDISCCVDLKCSGSANVIKVWAQLAETLQGKGKGVSSLSGSYLDENQVSQSKDPIYAKLAHDLHAARLVLYYLNGEYRNAENEITSQRGRGKGPWHFVTLILHVFKALTYYALARQTKNLKTYTKHAEPFLRTWVLLHSNCPSVNSKAIVSLLKAEKCSVNQDPVAIEYYDKAILDLHEGQFFLLEAVACERLAVFLRSVKSPSATRSFEIAIQKYQALGALTKAMKLRCV